jgi:phosphate transport system permease protein
MQTQVDRLLTVAVAPALRVRSWRRGASDRLATAFMSLSAAGTVLLIAAIGAVLLAKSWPILSQKPLLHLLLSSSWRPLRGEFGFFPFIVGTLWVTLLAMAISVPICLLAAVYLSEYAGKRTRAVAKPLVDLLAGIPPVVFGLCGMIAVVPLVEKLGRLAGAPTTGFSVLAGGLILAIMVLPIIISVCEEVLQSVPQQAREASLALGATRWQTVKHVLLRAVYPGLSAAVVLGFSRAFGETMAVLMVVGNVARPPGSLFDPAYPLPALIANQYGEMMTVRLYDSALMLAALMLMAVVLFFNLAARLIIQRINLRLVGAA